MVIKKTQNQTIGKFSTRSGESRPAKMGEKIAQGFGGDGSGGYNKNYNKRGLNANSGRVSFKSAGSPNVTKKATKTKNTRKK